MGEEKRTNYPLEKNRREPIRQKGIMKYRFRNIKNGPAIMAGPSIA